MWLRSPTAATGYARPVTDPRGALHRLRDAAASGALGALCERYGVSLLTVFGSVLRPAGVPRDLDVAVRFKDENADVLGFLDELGVVADTTGLDLMNLDAAGPVARERALVGAELLVESAPETFVRERLAAMMDRMDTDWLRRLNLRLMAR